MTGNRHDYRVTEKGIVWLDDGLSIGDICCKIVDGFRRVFGGKPKQPKDSVGKVLAASTEMLLPRDVEVANRKDPIRQTEAPVERLQESDYRANNFHLERQDATLFVDLTHPDLSASLHGGCRYVEIDQESEAPSDGIRVHFDVRRNGWAVERATVIAWRADDPVCDPKWEEVAFIPTSANAVRKGDLSDVLPTAND